MGKMLSVGLLTGLLFASLPASTNYRLDTYGVGSGGGVTSSSNYSIEGISGETNSTALASGTYSLTSGMIGVQQAHVPAAPTFTNPSSYYDKLKLVINTGGNPTDTTFAIAISPDAFASTTKYVQNDNTIGSALGIEDYQTYTSWGGASGFNIIGLASSTTYTVKVKAFHSNFTESAYSATASVATVGQQLSFSISPNSEALGSLLPATVTSSPSNVVASLDTNADAGAKVYITSANAGLTSAKASFTISSATADLGSGGTATGYGAEIASVTSLTKVSPYDGTGDNVGVVDTTLRTILSTTTPVTGGQGSITIKAKASGLVPAATDYADTLTIIAAAIF